MEYLVDQIRSQFPALASGAIFFDGPGGTQVPQAVIDAVSGYYRKANANEHGFFPSARRSDAIIAASRLAVADFINAASADEIVFGANMTTLTLQLARALGRTLKAGDEIVVSRLDHDANIAPWLHLQENGAVIRWLEIDPADCTLRLGDLGRIIGHRTKLVAVGCASNAFGTITDVAKIIAAAQRVGALTFLDAVHFAPHRPIDVQALGCDFLACSPYKFYGPHSGVLYGKKEALERLQPYKVRPASDSIPDCFETGTKNHEGLAGVGAAIDFLAALGRDFSANYAKGLEGYAPGRRRWLKQAMAAVTDHETRLFSSLLEGLLAIPGVRIYGITDPGRFNERTPTACFTLAGLTPAHVAKKMGEQGICVWDGNYYAWEPMKYLGLEEKGGAVRAGLCLYNTDREVDCFLESVKKLSAVNQLA
ncbi:MAG: cysteine desulfurase-like protein [Candidatus Aminicenantes bacterium]|nr:cysteine desulfurase-like protein [Candidatus Aminicenantes bacterium]